MLKSMNMKKRTRSEEEEISCRTNQMGIEEMAKCLMLLSHHYQNVANDNNVPIHAKPISMYRPEAAPKELVLTRFECTTCKRSFSSFQALGGHRASHKKPRVEIMKSIKAAAGTPSSRKHECSICGVVFSMGQALGGHMRRHRECRITSPPPPPPVVVLKRSTSHLKVSSINTFLDLNLTPLENDLKLLFGKMTPTKY